MKKIFLAAMAACIVFIMLGCTNDAGTDETKTAQQGYVTISFELWYQGAPKSPESITIPKGGKIAQYPEVWRDGFCLLGWFKYQGGDAWVKVTEADTFSVNTVLYARWEVPITVTFDLNYNWGPEPPEPVIIPANFEIGEGVLPVVEREGFDFLGWFTATSGGTQVTKNTVLTRHTHLFAQWDDKRADITVSYVLNYENFPGADTEPAPPGDITIKSGDMIGNINLLVITRPLPWLLGGWYTDPTGGEKIKRDTVLNGNTTLYAQWVEADGFLVDLSAFRTTTTGTGTNSQVSGTFGSPPSPVILAAGNTEGPGGTALPAGTLKLTFSGTVNAQAVCINLTTAQKDKVWAYRQGNIERKIMIIIDGYTVPDDATFRLGLNNPRASSNWNGTVNTAVAPLSELLNVIVDFNSVVTSSDTVQSFYIQNRGPYGSEVKVYIKSVGIWWDPTAE